MQFKGTHEFEEFWSYLCDETPRGLAVVIAAYFDEKLGVVFPAAKNKRFGGRIRDALLAGLICRSEHDALQIIRGLRNSFAHEIRSKDFDADKTAKINSLELWTKPAAAYPKYAELLPSPRERLLYIAAVICIRLCKRSGATVAVDYDPAAWRPDDWPPLTSI